CGRKAFRGSGIQLTSKGLGLLMQTPRRFDYLELNVEAGAWNTHIPKCGLIDLPDACGSFSRVLDSSSAAGGATAVKQTVWEESRGRWAHPNEQVVEDHLTEVIGSDG